MGFGKNVRRLLGRADRDEVVIRPPLLWPYYYLGGNRALTQLSNGLPFYVATDDRYISPWIMREGVWETFVDRVLMRLAAPGMRVCDIGANLGYHTIKLANQVGQGGHVLAIEPNPAVSSFLVDNVAINGYQNRVAVHRLAVGSAPGQVMLHYAGVNLGSGNLFGMAAEFDARSHEVEMVTLDSLTAGQAGFDIIKIDVEGWEIEVLRGMRDTLARSPQASIVIEVSWETWRRFGDPAEALKEMIGDRDGVFVIHQSGALERVPADNLERFNMIGVCYALLTPWARTAERLKDLVQP